MFVDASAIVAILTREPEADALADALEDARAPITSPLAVFEAVLGICRKRHASVAEATADVLAMLGAAGVQTVSITWNEAETTSDAFARYGKGRGHPAQLNLGDCFAYAVAGMTGRPCCSRGMISTGPTSLGGSRGNAAERGRSERLNSSVCRDMKLMQPTSGATGREYEGNLSMSFQGGTPAEPLRETAAVGDAAEQLRVSARDGRLILDLLEHPPTPNTRLLAAAAVLPPQMK